MNYKELPSHLQEFVSNLKYGSLTVEADVNDALEQAKDLAEFKDLANTSMDELIGEANVAKEQLN
jgi:hypothetical protein